MDVTPPPPVTELMLVSVGFSAPSSSVTETAPPTPAEPADPEPPPPPTTDSVTQQPAAMAGGHTYFKPSMSATELASGTGTLVARGDAVSDAAIVNAGVELAQGDPTADTEATSDTRLVYDGR